MKKVKSILFCFMGLFPIVVYAQIQQLGNTEFSNNLGTVKGLQITAGGSSGSVSNFIIDPAGNADLKASNFISMQPGFAVKEGATFSANVNLNFNINNIKIPREVLEGYLNRSLELANISDIPNIWDDNIRMLQNIRPKLLITLAGIWAGAWDDGSHYNRAQTLAQRIHSEVDGEIVCQAFIAEAIAVDLSRVDTNYQDGNQNNFTGILIPQYVLNEFPDASDSTPRVFDFLKMISPDKRPSYTIYYGTIYNHQYYGYTNAANPDQTIEYVDISQRETQMWYYYRATKYINRGYESIWFGQSAKVDDYDPQHVNYWSLLQKIRSYASTKNRGIVICTSDGDASSFYNGSYGGQLLFDYHRSPHRPQELKDSNGNYIYRKAYIDPNCGGGGVPCIYNQTFPGITPSSETVTNQNYLIDFDWYGPTTGTHGVADNDYSKCWGWDEAAWWGLFDITASGGVTGGIVPVNNDGATYRNQYLSYMYNQARCFSPSGFAAMPGLFGISGTDANFTCPSYAYLTEGPYCDQSASCNYYSSKYYYNNVSCNGSWVPVSVNTYNQEDQIRNIFNFNSYGVSCGTYLPRIGVQDTLLSNTLTYEEGLVIYPNPNSGIFSINIKDSNSKNIKELWILNSMGQQIFFKNNFENDLANIEVSLKDQPNGLYFVKARINNKISFQKVIILK
jgi:hypothetical protein